MDKKTQLLLERLSQIPVLSWETPDLLLRLNQEGVTLQELSDGIDAIEAVIELTDSHDSQTYRICRKLVDLPASTIVDGVPIGF